MIFTNIIYNKIRSLKELLKEFYLIIIIFFPIAIKLKISKIKYQIYKTLI